METYSQNQTRNKVIIMEVKNTIKKFYNWLISINFVELFINTKKDIINSLNDLRGALKDLKGTNLKLAHYHMQKGNIKDAIIRYKLLDMFISPNDPEIHYNMAICYFLNNNYSKAEFYLSKTNTAEGLELKNFLKQSEVKEIPQNLLTQYRHAKSEELVHRWSSYQTYLPKAFINAFFSKIEELPKECNILDLGCASGLIGYEIDYKLEKNYKLTGVDNIKELTDYTKHLREDKRKVYDEIIELSVKDFLEKNKNIYNIIISFQSLDFNKDLQPYFLMINKILSKKGFFVLLLQTSKETNFDKAKTMFVYSDKDIENKLKLAEFNILDIKEWNFNKYSNYTMFIVTK